MGGARRRALGEDLRGREGGAGGLRQGFELWTVNSGSIFDNVFVTDDLEAAWAHADAHWGKISEGEKEAQEAYDKANKPPEPEPSDDDTEDLDDEDGADADDEDL